MGGREERFVGLVWFLLSGICHQIPERSLHFQGQPLPLCARCTGVFVAVPMAVFALWAIGQGRRSGFPRRAVWGVMGLLAAGWAVDGLNSTVALIRGAPLIYAPSNLLRLASGAGLGISLGIVIYPIYHLALFGEGDPRRVLAEPWSVLALLGAGAAWVTLALLWPRAPYRLVFAIVTVGALGSLTLVNGLLWALMLNLTGRYLPVRRIGTAAIMGLLSALLEIGLLATLRLLLVA
jgi:uncharacterized membrane protein